MTAGWAGTFLLGNQGSERLEHRFGEDEPKWGTMMNSPGEFNGHWATVFGRLGGLQTALSSAQDQFYLTLSV